MKGRSPPDFLDRQAHWLLFLVLLGAIRFELSSREFPGFDQVGHAFFQRPQILKKCGRRNEKYARNQGDHCVVQKSFEAVPSENDDLPIIKAKDQIDGKINRSDCQISNESQIIDERFAEEQQREEK